MYLKSIEVQGFKSFANKISFQFHNGITGIVGPNGSGKSNVADAVRWVLGEQRIKQLRGASMQDVIFAGTEMRKPLSYAYVAITLDNSDHQLAIDFDEVTVARRLYRSGESEYLINGAPCRLKDVNEMFYDTGIGKEGYSIIGQGQIDAILSGKPEERRELFDEAAGIVKFKKRKMASEKKLEEEHNNLTRVNDILSELERQIGPLERQAEKARVYLKKKEELKTLDVNMFLLENNSTRANLEEVSRNLDIAAKDFEDNNQKLENIKKEYQETVDSIEALEKTIEEERTTLSETGTIRQRLENQIEVLKEQINSIKGNESHLKNRQSSVTEELEAKNKEVSSVQNAKQIIDEKLKAATQEKEEVEYRLYLIHGRIEELNEKIEENKNAIIDNLSKRADIKSRAERLSTVKEQIDIRKAELTSKLVNARTDEAKQQDVIEGFSKEFQNITEKITEGNNTQKELEEKNIAMRQELSRMDERLHNLQVKYHQDKAKLESLSNITERYEGYGGSVKMVMEQKDSNKGIIGVVADIISTDKEYETAIETALGGNIQNVVTDDEDTAKKMIELLKKNRGGRATFLPLTSIQKPQEFKTPEVLKEKGVLGMADALVKTKKEYANVAKAMLGRIVVIDNVDNAVKIARKYEYGIRMVTLEGELLVPGGAIAGGAFKNNSNLLSRRREMDELNKAMESALKEIDEINNNIEITKKERNSIRVEIEKQKMSLQELLIRQNTARLNLQAAKSKQAESQADVDSLKNEADTIELQLRDNDAEKERILTELSESERFESDTARIIEELQKELEAASKEESEISTDLKDKEVAVEKASQRVGFEETNLERILGEKERFASELKEITDELEGSLDSIDKKEEDIVKLKETIKASYTSEKNTQTKLTEDIAAKERLSEKQKSFFGIREELSETISRLDREVYRLGEQKIKLGEAIQSRIDYMWNEYEITLVDADKLRDPEMSDLPQMKRDVANVRDDIKKLGDVNVNAIDDFKEVSERYTFLKTQHDDLVEAEKTLMGIIEELDTAMRRQFKDKFQAIEKEFDKVFKELFGGGVANLELMEEQDILEAGIKIIAQPPGKKLQNMMQLSGGEKALTAIALLFAILNLKPSPFCLLDEIEAALDENNVGRFAKYLHKLSKNTQFIVITHRRGTMERSDRLYGITMQEKGISTLVSVNMVEDELK